MKYLLLIKDSKGETHLVEVSGNMEIEVAPGDDIVVMDEDGQPVEVSLRPSEEDLLVEFPDETLLTLKDFYTFGDWSNPVTISLNPVDPQEAEYEFNSQTGNLPEARGFSLMRFSSVDNIEFVDAIDRIDLGSARRSSGGGDPEPINLPPDAEDDLGETEQGAAVLIDVLSNDSDPDGGDQLTISGVDQPALGSAVVNSSNQIVFDPGSDFDYLDEGESATVTFTYSISDGKGGGDSATVTVTVNGLEDETETQPDSSVTDEETPVVIDVLANDFDPDTNDGPLSITSITQPALGSVVTDGSTVTFDPGTDFQGLAAGESATVTFTYTTSTGETENATVTINGANDGPDAVDDAAVTSQNSPITIDAIANDTDPDTSDSLVITGVNQPARGSVSLNINQLVFNPGNDFDDLDSGESATVTFDYSITDGNGGTDTATVTVTVNGADDATVTNPDSDVTDEDTVVTTDALSNDSDVDTSDNPLTIASVTQPALGSVTNNGSDVTFNPGSDFQYLAEGESATVTYTYTTDTGVTENVTVTVNGVNDGPDAVDDDSTTDQGTPLSIDVLANDTDPDTNDNLIVLGVDQPAKGFVSIANGNRVIFDPNGEFDELGAGESATVTFDYVIYDGSGGTDTATVTVTVNGMDDATVTNPDRDITDENTPVTIDLLANDSDLDASDNPLTIVSVTQPGLGSVTNNGTDVTFDPGTDFDYLAAGENATVTFTYTTDTGVTENVTVTVDGLNDGPDALDDASVTDQDNPVIIDAIANDTDPDVSDNLVITGVNQPVKGSVSLNSNQLVFDPDGEFDDLDAGESATVTFDYSISDGNGGTDTATVTLTVNGIDDATVTNPDADITDENTAVTIDVLANDSDVDTNDNPLTIASVTQPALGSVANNGTDVTFDPGADFDYLAVGESSTVTFTYTTDTGVTENVTVTVNGVNDGPEAVNDMAVTGQDNPVTIDAVANDTDPDTSDNLIITGVNQPLKGSVSLNSNQLVFDPDGEFNDLGLVRVLR